MWLNFDGAIMRNKIILIFMFVGFGLFVVYQFINHQRPAIPFEPEKWQTASTEPEFAIRLGMARSLINQKLLIGKTREEVREILGKPQYDERQNKISYILEEKYWIIDPVSIEWLEITFNEENKVEKAEVRFQKIGR
jgi:hypothetical protein